MRILVIGAAGRTGRHVVEQALGHGHEVRAFVHLTEPTLSHQRLELVRGDVLVFDDVERAVDGCDAVAFAAAPGKQGALQVCSAGIGNVLHAMAVHEVPVLVAVSAAGVFARSDARLSLSFRIMVATSLRQAYDDLEAMEQRIAASGVDWTIVRAGGLSDAPQSGHYRLSQDGSILPKMARVPRADVAAMVLKAIETGAFTRRTLLIAG